MGDTKRCGEGLVVYERSVKKDRYPNRAIWWPNGFAVKHHVEELGTFFSVARYVGVPNTAVDEYRLLSHPSRCVVKPNLVTFTLGDEGLILSRVVGLLFDGAF